MKRIRIFSLGLLVVGTASCAWSALIAADDFNRSDSNTLGSTSTGSLPWNEQETVAGGLRIAGNQLAAGSTTAGREYGTVNLSSSAFYSPVLANSAGLVTWAINMRQTRTSPSGFDDRNYGLAFVLAVNSQDYTAGNGYAVILGNSGGTDPIRLARFTGGLDLNSNFTGLISSGDYGIEYLNIRVTYNPSGNQWSLYLTSSGSGFSDPTLVTTQIGSTTADSTYTGSALNYSGILWNHNTSGTDSALFDNYSVSVVPESVNLALLLFGPVFGGVAVIRHGCRRSRL